MIEAILLLLLAAIALSSFLEGNDDATTASREPWAGVNPSPDAGTPATSAQGDHLSAADADRDVYTHLRD